MKPVIIIVIAFVLLIPIPIFAQEVDNGTRSKPDPNQNNEELLYYTLILEIGSVITATGTGIYFCIHLHLQKSESKRQALLERFNTFNDSESKRGREVIVHAEYNSDGKFKGKETDYKIFRRELGILDTTANMVRSGDIPKDRFLELLSHVIIITYESAEPYIKYVRHKRGTHWASDFIWLYNEADNWWKKNRPNDPRPTKDDDFFVKVD